MKLIFCKSPGYSFSILLTVVFVFTGLFTNSQASLPVWGNFSAEEISMKECSFDKEAEAIILLDEGNSTYDDDFRLITQRRIRVKILNKRGLDWANISIPFYSKDDFESVQKIEAITYNFEEGNNSTFTQLDKKTIYKVKKDAYYSMMKFAMPAIKEGSIIEYRYEISTKRFSEPDDWEFQYDLPVVKSSYLLEVPPTAEFTYQIQKKQSLSIIVKPIPDQGKVYYEMNYIPALRFEPYMDAARDYVQKVTFQLAGVVNRQGHKEDVNTTWRSLAIDLMTEKYFGSQLDKDLKADEVMNLVKAETSDLGKIKTIYEYLKKNIEWNGYDGKYANDGLKAVLDRKKGSAGELNLLMINLLKTAGIVTYPILVAERDFGKIDTLYPFVDRFNKVVALAYADGKQYILDATQENCPVGLTPYPLLNTRGFLVDKKIYNLIRIAPGNKSYKNVITVNGKVDSKGSLTAEAYVKSYDYARQIRLDAVKRDKRRFINDIFEKPYEGLSIDSFLVVSPESDSTPLVQIVQYKQQLNESGGFIFFNANLFTGLEKNPFSSSVRFTNVNFGFPYDVILEEKIKLPEGVKVDLPKDKTLVSGDNNIKAVRQVSFENGELKVLIRFVQTTTLVTANAYNEMKGFYKIMTDMLNEPIVLKLPN